MAEPRAEALQRWINPHPAHTPRLGMLVFDKHEQHVGPVADVRGGFFRIDAIWDPDLWLSEDLVAEVIDGQLAVLAIGFDDLDSWRVPRLSAA